ncbi:PLP-dependent aminotransferase family protein [Asanoa sp. WMMD1127]|uniref:MocR-like pyridoxine biosynthesis transcription factor PdxR n=1 Tax=Asanoa sp. WMMD1127 TaxID=3016107 RepID=UPI0024175679|nr:PLP-dependent aminotransferase family protein [Asanoa sp. WMMD1127]MDG4824807.1 PLP-dependent aminotransferase family protein [Asanoa sp. WMMD1127]
MADSQTNSAWATLLDLSGAGPTHQRLARALRGAIRSGRLPTGSAVPPSRALAEELGCSRWVVTEAYGQLVTEGYLAARVGSATRVAWVPDDPPAGNRRPPRQRAKTPAPRLDLAPGLPDLRAFPRRRWADSVAAVTGDVSVADLGLPDPRGHPRARRTIAEYLQRSRGAVARADTVTICAGITDGLTRVARALRRLGVDAVAVEEPGWPRVRAALAGAGLHVRAVPLDHEGLRVDALAGVRAVVTGAAHQFPSGVVLSPARRAALVRWARAVDGFVVEDDYDAEFRYDRRPIAAMQGLDPGRVALLGSVSKTLSPALGLGWLLAPGRLTAAADPVATAPPVLDQLALATFVDRGWYDAHLRAARRRFRTRRDLLLAALREAIPEGRLEGTAAGLHVLLRLPDGTDTAAVVRRAARAGLQLVALDAYRAEPSTRPAPVLVLGYGNLADGEIAPAVATLRRTLDRR